jgi:dTDP-4-amino-4,6-dideoxygalactose transaminase
MSKKSIPFNKPYMTGKELEYISQCHLNAQLSGDGPFTKKCHKWLEDELKVKKALLTHSCTAALEMTVILMNLKEGDEVIMPSFTFVSTANAFVLRGIIPVFVDIRPDTLNIDEKKIECAITDKTKAIVVVHYAGVVCEMNVISEIAHRHNLYLIEDAAQAALSMYEGKPAGSLGDMSTLSFHETKNIISGEGGALLINKDEFNERAQIIREKGTNRTQFFEGKVDKYSWVDIGSSYLPGELIAAYLWAQLENCREMTDKRISAWNFYHKEIERFEIKELLTRPFIPENCESNAHCYYIIVDSEKKRNTLLSKFNDNGINAVFHYIPLHSSIAGRKYSRSHGGLTQTEKMSSQLIRLPIWNGIKKHEQERVLEVLEQIIEN